MRRDEGEEKERVLRGKGTICYEKNKININVGEIGGEKEAIKGIIKKRAEIGGGRED